MVLKILLEKYISELKKIEKDLDDPFLEDSSYALGQSVATTAIRKKLEIIILESENKSFFKSVSDFIIKVI